jgi:hypothetical protein
MDSGTVRPRVIENHHAKLLSEWLKCQRRDGAFRNGQVSSARLTDHATRFLTELRSGRRRALRRHHDAAVEVHACDPR